jgi:putative ABC transport system substrate-binding protein
MEILKMKKTILFTSILLLTILLIFSKPKQTNLPVIAIANYGPHSSLEDSIDGIKKELESQGFIEHKNIIYDIADVGFDSSLIPQMINKLKNTNPKIMVAITTPVAQFAKHAIKDTPLIFSVITDPVEAGLLKDATKNEDNATCVSDKQDLSLLLSFAKKLLPHAKKVGVLYSTSEANDHALIKMLEKAAVSNDIEVVAIAIDQARDVAMRVQGFKDKVDFIYVGSSGPIQPTLPTIIAEANKMHIPIFNLNEEAVKNNQVLASFGVDYHQVGINTGKVIAKILRNEGISQPLYPSTTEHHGFISQTRAKHFNITIPDDLTKFLVKE